MLTTIISRMREDEMLQAIQDLQDRGFEIVGNIIQEHQAPKRFSPVTKKRYKFEDNDQCVKYKAKMVKRS